MTMQNDTGELRRAQDGGLNLDAIQARADAATPGEWKTGLTDDLRIEGPRGKEVAFAAGCFFNQSGKK